MTKVLIVSKTHMSNAACVGALTGNGSSIRLLDQNGYNQPVETDYNIRQIWEIEYARKHSTVPPHVEDVLVTSSNHISTMEESRSMRQMIERNNAAIARGIPDVLFNGCLNWTNSGSGYISQEGDIPPNSVGFWIPDRPLRKKIFYDRIRYDYPNVNGWRSLPFVGFADAVNIIPAGTLVRVSLARWWDRNGETELRCSLQLSGWYDLENPEPPPPPPPPPPVFDNGIDDLPF